MLTSIAQIDGGYDLSDELLEHLSHVGVVGITRPVEFAEISVVCVDRRFAFMGGAENGGLFTIYSELSGESRAHRWVIRPFG